MQLLKWGQKKVETTPVLLAGLSSSPPLHFPCAAPPLSALCLEQHPLPYLCLPHLFQSIAIIRSRNMQVEYRATLYSSQLLLSVSNLTFQTPPSPSPPPLSHRLIIIIHHHPPIHHLTRTTLPPSLHHSRRIVVVFFFGVLFGYTSPLSPFLFLQRNTEKKCPRIDGIANIMDVDVILVVVSIWNDIR